MNGTKRFFTVFIFLAAFIAGGCAPPIGTLLDSEGGTEHNLMWAVPNRVVYILNEFLKPEEDLLIFASSRGIIEPVPVGLVDISVVEFPGLAIEQENLVSDMQEGYCFEFEGRKIVNISYNSMAYRYNIQVGDPSVGGNGGGTGPGPGVVIDWP
ncbi:MAG: hypothetical protein LBB72_05745 [Spirochaetaceae bacterium]|jgi:hypothetical protein|nr:hypothetical protein [Spirochaetaceae bacterium]